ncbi:hypothetical protein CDV26_05430 [Francisella halioticida]|uniref:Major facilitator superfamily (MFS) profile domain-containing protein n=1 Tax=Francisella halioticida TaxID=549298 RepID=A0ABM6LZ76_9GAMM|nr:MFS transporter [Francisella halioticida]ASG67900.1 hypothetical protein CDV26_05430 [Francisella halioticida]
MRVLQGLSAGGQFGNLMVLTAEQEKQSYRGFNLAVAYATSVVGFLLASGISYLTLNFLPGAWQYYAWRVPFALGFFLLLIHFFIKENEKVKNTENNFKVEPIRQLLTHYPWRLTLIICLSTTAMVLYYLDITYMVTYMETELNLSLSTALAINTISIVIMCVVMPLAGYLSDIIGRKKTHIASYIILLVLCVPMVMFMQFKSVALVTAMIIAMAALTSIIQGVSNTVLYRNLSAKSPCDRMLYRLWFWSIFIRLCANDSYYCYGMVISNSGLVFASSSSCCDRVGYSYYNTQSASRNSKIK